MKVKRIFDLLELYKDQFPGKPDAITGKEDRKWRRYSSKDYIDLANAFSCGLISLGLKKGDKVATICNNRPEWNFADMGMAQLGIVHVPMFTNLDQSRYKQLLDHAEVRVVFVGGLSLAKKITPLIGDIESLKFIYSFDKIEGVHYWRDMIDAIADKKEQLIPQVERIKESVDENDVATLIYTSGTTGEPKGVLLSHRNLISTAKVASGVFKLKSDQRYLSILPLCHVGERMANYQTQYSGCSIYYSEAVTTIARDLMDIKPHGFGAVPRILEKVFEKIISKGSKLTGVKKKLFFWALDLGQRYELNNANGYWYALQLFIANKIIFSKWREALGGNVVAIGIGGAALQPKLEKVFWAAGIKLLNMYGLTETSPIITINRQSGVGLRLGTVGSLVDGVEVRIAKDGEILCRGPNVMIGYFKDEAATKSAIDNEGWFHTGDIGVLEDGFLRITDRKKEIFKLANGKYILPLFIENLMKESMYIDQIIVIGEGEKYASAIISPNIEMLEEWCREMGVDVSDKEGMIKNKKVQKHFNDIVHSLNKSLPLDEQVKRFQLVADEWGVETGELSPTLKLKRRVLLKKYAALIDKIYLHQVENK